MYDGSICWDHADVCHRPLPEAAILLTAYDFTLANQIFRIALLGRDSKRPINDLLSLSSYLLQHAHRSTRTALYSRLALLTIQILLEDAAVAKRLNEAHASVRLCRQRQPYLPLTTGDRSLAAVTIDIMVDGINHNLRTKLDTQLYISSIGIILRLITFLSRSRTRLAYHWPELWRSLLAFMRFLIQYEEQLRLTANIDVLVADLVSLIMVCIIQGETFLPDSAAMDDLFYKLVEFGPSLQMFKAAYALTQSSVAANMDVLLGVSEHFSTALGEANGKSKSVSPREVMKAIKEGYQTLSIETKEGADQWKPYREQDHKVELKTITRMIVADARRLNSDASKRDQ